MIHNVWVGSEVVLQIFILGGFEMVVIVESRQSAFIKKSLDSFWDLEISTTPILIQWIWSYITSYFLGH